jgi:hypothetical protein
VAELTKIVVNRNMGNANVDVGVDEMIVRITGSYHSCCDFIQKS